MTPAASTVAERVIERLHQLGVRTLFGVHGANAEDVFDAAVRHSGLTPVIAKHEFGAGAMADGLARIAAVPGAVLTTSGGGALNVVPALGESYDARVPVLAIIGTPPRPTVGRGGFQDMLDPPDTIDLPAILSGVTGCCRVVDDPAALEAAFDDAEAALRRGLPAALLIPKDVQASPASAPAGRVAPPAGRVAPLDGRPSTGSGPAQSRPPSPPAGTDLADRLRAAARGGGRICLWAGEEASRARIGDALHTLAERLGAELVVSPGGRDLGRPDCPGVTGVMGHPSAHAAIGEADLVLAVGCRLTLTDRAGLDEALTAAETIHLGTQPPRLPGVEHVAVDDLPGAIDALLAALGEQSAGTAHRPRIREYLAPPESAAQSGPPPMREVIETIGAALPPGCSVFADAGNTGAAAIHHLPFHDGRFVVALGMGGMGYAIAAGIGTAIGTGERTAVIAGDGSFLMHGMELHTAVEQHAPVTLIVLNNNAHGMCVTRENLYFPSTAELNRFGETDIAAGLAAMFPGLDVRRATDASSLITACAELLARPGPHCLVVDVDPDEVPPFGPFLKGTP